MKYATATKAADWGECCFCRNDTRTIWHGEGGKRIAYACTFVHLTREYPAYLPERRSEFVDRRGSDRLAQLALRVDWLSLYVVGNAAPDRTHIARELDAIRFELTGKPCQPVT